MLGAVASDLGDDAAAVKLLRGNVHRQQDGLNHAREPPGGLAAGAL